MTIHEINSRYVLPTVEEKTAYGYKRQDPYTKLFEERIIFMGQPIDDTVANDVMAQLLTLESMDPDRDIMIYINSPGGVVTAGLSILDTMNYIRCDVATVCLGQACSAGSLLLTAGTKGKRYALTNSRIMIHQPHGGAQGQATDIEIQAREILNLRARLNRIYADCTGQPLETINEVMERDRFMSAEEAVAYGLIDHVQAKRPLSFSSDKPLSR